MKITLFSYTRKGCETAFRIMDCFENDEKKAFTMERFCKNGFLPLDMEDGRIYEEMFSRSDLMIFVGACGIAVRKIAPFVKDKCTDPAVICVDESGKFAIPILSGHLGVANDFAKKIADSLGAVCVVTTATDINNRFSVDLWAKRQGFVIDDMQMAKKVASEILERDVPVYCEFEVKSGYPKGIISGKGGDLGIYIGIRKESPFDKTLRIVTPVLHLGIGCRRGTEFGSIAKAVDKVLEDNNIDRRAIKCVASAELKSNEKGLLEYCRENGWDAVFYKTEELKAVLGEFTSSEFVKSVVGVDNVSERAAVIGADKLIVKKTVLDGVTAAIAAENPEVWFE